MKSWGAIGKRVSLRNLQTWSFTGWERIKGKELQKKKKMFKFLKRSAEKGIYLERSRCYRYYHRVYSYFEKLFGCFFFFFLFIEYIKKQWLTSNPVHWFLMLLIYPSKRTSNIKASKRNVRSSWIIVTTFNSAGCG